MKDGILCQTEPEWEFEKLWFYMFLSQESGYIYLLPQHGDDDQDVDAEVQVHLMSICMYPEMGTNASKCI